MDLTILGEYALKPALNVGLRLKKLYTSEVDDSIIAAFEFALNDWSKHTPTTSDKVRLSKALEEYIQSSTSYEDLDLDTRAFIDCFKKRLSEQTAAHNYLMTLRADMQEKREEQNLLEHHKTQESVLDLKSRMEGLSMTQQYIRALLKELPLEQGLEPTELALEEMLTSGRIHSEGAKRLVLEFARFFFEHTDKISEEAKLLREAGDSYLAETLEEIKRVLTGESEQSLTDVHKKYQEQVQQDEIRILKELIEAAQIQFSFGEARDFYERLIELSPTIDNHFSYAYLLQGLNDFDKARSHYEAALQILREWEAENTEAYKPDIATTLNNLGSLHCDTNDFKQAQVYYMEALQIYREVSKQNPEAYKPAVATSLNNLGILLKETNELEQARAYNEESLALYRELSEQNPKAYMPDVAMSLNNLGVLLKNTNELEQARACYEESLALYRELSEQTPKAYLPAVATSLNNLGNLLKNTNELQQARTYYEEALEIRRELFEQNPEAYKPAVATSLNNLGILLKETNELQQARACYEEALEIRRELSEQNPEAYKPAVATSLNNLGVLLKNTNELGQARTYYEEALEICRELSEQNPKAYMPDVAMSLNNLGILLKETNELQQARAYYEEALEIYREMSEQNPEAYKPNMGMVLTNLTLLYLQQVKKEEAGKAYQEAHDIYQDLASCHPRAYGIDYAQLLGIGFALLGKPKEDLEEAKAILDKYPEHPKAQELLSHIEQLANG